jgi:hypothetical protein
MKAIYVIEQLGGVTSAARFFGIKPPSIAEWKAKNKIPEGRIWQLRHLRPDLFGADSSVTPVGVDAPVVCDERVGDGDER